MISIYSFLPRCTELHKLHNDLSFLSDNQADTSWGNQIFTLPETYTLISQKGVWLIHMKIYTTFRKKKIHIMSITYIMITTAKCTLG